MKAIINGITYNTVTSKKLGYWRNSCESTDSHYYSESLFETKSKKYFLLCEGGPLGKYLQSLGNAKLGIVPITAQEAMKWCKFQGLFISVSFIEMYIRDRSGKED